MSSVILQRAKYDFNCNSCGKFRAKGSWFYKFSSETGTPRFYCEACSNERFKKYTCQQCGKKWVIFKKQESGWDDYSFVWIDDEKKIFKYGNRWLCYKCYNKNIREKIRTDPVYFLRICESNKPPENYRFYKLVSTTNCKYYFNCGFALKYGYCKEICKVKCEVCGKEIRIDKCEVHHKRKLPRDSKEYKYENPENLLIICKSCHKKEEKNVKFWNLAEFMKTRKCISCDNTISKGNKSGLCPSCEQDVRKDRERKSRSRLYRGL